MDWTQPHHDAVRAKVRSELRQVLYRRDVRPEYQEPLHETMMRQAEAIYGNWPLAA